MAFATTEKLQFKEEDLAESIRLVNELGKIEDDKLAERGMKPGEVQKIYRFLTAVTGNKSTLVPSQAITLMRLTPVLFPLGKNIVHDIVRAAAPTVSQVYERMAASLQQETDKETKQKCMDGMRVCAAAMKTAGEVCMRRGMDSIVSDRRKAEFSLFEPFIGGTVQYKENLAHFQERHKAREFKPILEPVEVVKIGSGRGSFGGYGRQYDD